MAFRVVAIMQEKAHSAATLRISLVRGLSGSTEFWYSFLGPLLLGSSNDLKSVV